MNMNMEGSRNNIDRISALPNNLILRILWFTGTKSAVRTGLLSKRWRCLWTSVPVLDFDQQEFCHPLKGPEDFEKLIEKTVCDEGSDSMDLLSMEGRIGLDEFVLFVNATLKRCARLIYEGYIDPRQLSAWINHAVSRNVADLELELPTHKHMSCDIYKGCCEMPSSIFQCKALTSLKLRMTQYWFFSTPATVKLHSLVSLHLNAIVWRDDSLENVISKCPNLETLYMNLCSFQRLSVSSRRLKDLTICDCRCPVEIQVFAPNLLSLYYSRSWDEKISLKCSSKLVNARVDVIGEVVGPSFTSMVLYKEMHLLKLLPTFPNLKHLKIKADLPDIAIEALACLLKHSPALETLKITDFRLKFPAFLRDVNATDDWKSRKLSSDCLLHLKEVKMKGFDSSPRKLEFLKFLLMNSDATTTALNKSEE
ncbi:F-box/FBD/LRR-repeat protein [Acorus calamus]|uniref:F-box/FBD/LRR-repeat protein n=1 Tax=Acorus calamus TaxID=4465 RepID=A0AAV9FHU6_ACOCL|nr:F-box/FBD/LRR-repeat protein [Acorus calamus]